MSNFYIKYLKKQGKEFENCPKFVQKEIKANRRHQFIVMSYNEELNSGLGFYRKYKGGVSTKKMLAFINR